MLHRKLLRDLRQMSGQAITIALVVACGTAIFVASLSTYHSLIASQENYYETSHFADLFAGLKRAPLALEKQISSLPGVGWVETRVAFDVTIDLPEITVPLSGRMIGLPVHGLPQLNRLELRRGRFPVPGRDDEALVSEAFAAANKLEPGDRFRALLHGKRQLFRIVGIALSPEFVFATPAGDPIPDDKHFGIFWIGNEPMAAAFDMEGAFNDVAIALAPGAQPRQVMENLDRLLEPYGGLITYDRSQQPSHRFLTDEIRQQGTMAATVPVIFLAVAAFLLNIVLNRLVLTQRGQIASLKALGYFDAPIAMHYMMYGSVVTLSGAMLGLLLGMVLGQLMTEYYTFFLRFPILSYRLELWVPLAAIFVVLAAAFSGAFPAVRSVIRLAPAQAMRQPSPPSYRGGVFDRVTSILRLSTRWRIPLRNALGRPIRTALSMLAIALAVPPVMLSLFWWDALDYMIDVQFAAVERANAVVAFTDPVPARAAREVAHMPGMVETEATRSVPVRLRAGTRSYRTAISGLSPDARLRRLLDSDLHALPLPPEGLLLSRRLGERLGIGPGDRVSIDVLEGSRPTLDATVTGLVDDMIGLSAYMDIRALNRLMKEGDTISAVSMLFDPRNADSIYRQLKEAPKVATVTLKAASIQSFRATIATFVLWFATIFILFATTIAVGVVYNNTRVTLQERAREFASLRVLGFTKAEVSRLLFGEIVVEGAVGIPLGFILGYWMIRGLILLHETEMFSIPATIQPRTYAVAGGIVLLAGLASALVVRRQIDLLDPVRALKTWE